jgi:hypothetical protein
MNFNDFYWHDSVIYNITINRNNPGVNDEIIFEIQWTEQKNKALLVFEEVYMSELKLNFGIVAEETILSASTLSKDNSYLAEFYTKWKGAMDDIKLNTYKIDLNSTGGKIIIIAKSFRVE